MKQKEKIGIIGGTFDPIHNGHLYIAENARKLCNLSKVIFIPSAKPPHKQGKHISDATQRLEMCSLAIQDNNCFEVSDIEIKRNGLSYTVATLKELKEYYSADTEIYFICGADMLADMPNWHLASELLTTNKFIALARPGYTLNQIVKQHPLLKQNTDNITLLNIMPIKISSTMIRNSVKQGHSVKYLLPKKVENYINQHNLYRV